MPVNPKKRSSPAWQAHEYALQKKREATGDEDLNRKDRAKARRAYDKAGIDRKGMDIDHKVPLEAGGSADIGNTRLMKPSENRSFPRKGGGGVGGHKPVNTLKRGKK